MKTKIDIKATVYEEGLIESIDPNVLEIFDQIKLMPDTHVGKGVPIGFVAKYENKIIPAVVGLILVVEWQYIQLVSERLTLKS